MALGGIGATVTPVEAEIHYSGPIRQVDDATFTLSTQNARFALSGGAVLPPAPGLSSHPEGVALLHVVA